MSNKKFAKRMMKNLSNNMSKLTSQKWKNTDGTYTIAIPVPTLMMSETYTKLCILMSKKVANYIKSENIDSPKQWDIMADNEDFKIKTVNRVMNDYGQICCGSLKIDMIEYAPILLQCIEELRTFSKELCDTSLTPITGLKYEWLPIVHAAALIIMNNIDWFAPEYLDFFKSHISNNIK